ncbi:hypothetical protein MMC13_000014 [Lambiella insularis]|nr:hypothetical protein [Lambiella insularis]
MDRLNVPVAASPTLRTEPDGSAREDRSDDRKVFQSRRGDSSSRDSAAFLSTDSVKKGASLEDQYHTEDLHLHYPRKRRSWHTRPRSPYLKWYKEYNAASLKRGRVLVIDYVKRDLCSDKKRKVTSQEIHDLEGLQKIYSNPVRGSEAVLRLFHAQNAPWATEFLLSKFNISAQDDLVGLDFDGYLRHKRPERRGRKLAMTGRSWQTQHDPWRGVSKTAFGIDYLKAYRVPDDADRDAEGVKGKVMELNCFDHDDNPCSGWDVYLQRLSCYIQHKETSPEVVDPDIPNPYKQASAKGVSGFGRNQHCLPRLEDLDNCSAILIFEDSKSGSIQDTIIPSRRKMESRWRRLPFYLAFESQDPVDDEQMALQCTKLIMQDLWKAAAEAWEVFLDVSNGHIGILEDKIYENPADESVAPELWTNSNMWLNVERLILVHKNVVRECQANLRELADGFDNWLENTPGDFERLSNLIQEDMVKPTANLADLMYKSVGIRDARHQVELSISVWRLSWLSFIFLPLSFLCSFFSMQVTIFSDTPSIKWYFVAAAPMMLGVFSSWYILKLFLDGARGSSYARGIYEHLFWEMATIYPTLWTRTGPRQSVHPNGMLERAKWWLITRWSAPERTIKIESVTEDSLFDGLGAWSRLKRRFIRQWTVQIQGKEKQQASAVPAADDVTLTATGLELGKYFTNLSQVAPNADPEALRVPLDMNRRMSILADSSRRSGSAGRPSTGGSSAGRNSGVMVEEERLDWLENP